MTLQVHVERYRVKLVQWRIFLKRCDDFEIDLEIILRLTTELKKNIQKVVREHFAHKIDFISKYG
jgi:hypothetical protein